LELCDKQKASTIAFPALGAGNLKYPQNVVADIMIDTSVSYLKANLASTSIKTVKMVIFMDDTYKEFNKRIARMPANPLLSSVTAPFEEPEEYAPTTVEPVSYHSAATSFTDETRFVLVESKSFTVGPVKVVILEGDITEDDSDAIVNTTNEQMQLVGSGVAGAILQKGGPEMQKACNAAVSQGFRLQEGKVCDTPSSGRLKCKHVFHIVVPQNQKQLLGKTVAACLKRAEILQLSSLALPAIGTGVLGYTLDEAAHSICSSIIAFGQTNPVHVKQVRIVIFQQAMFQSFRDKFVEIVNKPGLLKRMVNIVSSWFSGDSSVEEPVGGSKHILPTFPSPSLPPSRTTVISEKSVLLIQIYAENMQKVGKTENRLQRIIEDQFANEKMFDQLLSKLSSTQKDNLTKKAKQRHVEITIETGTELNYIRLRGDRNDIADLKFFIQQILNQISASESMQREAALLQAKVKWQWLNDNGKYEDYDELTNYHVEEAYKRDKDKKFVYKTEDSCEEFDFKKMVASEDNLICKIKRVDIADLLKECMLIKFVVEWYIRITLSMLPCFVLPIHEKNLKYSLLLITLALPNFKTY